MEFIKVDTSNIDILYNLNLQLAADENQKDLFTASRSQYSNAFLRECPVAFGILSYIDNQVTGFYIYSF